MYRVTRRGVYKEDVYTPNRCINPIAKTISSEIVVDKPSIVLATDDAYILDIINMKVQRMGFVSHFDEMVALNAIKN